MKNKKCNHICKLCKYNYQCPWYKEYKYERKIISNSIFGRVSTADNNHSITFSNIRTNKEKQGMTFSTALELVKYGIMVSREAWDNPEFYLYMYKSIMYDYNIILLHTDNVNEELSVKPYKPTMLDLLANDWYIVC